MAIAPTDTPGELLASCLPHLVYGVVERTGSRSGCSYDTSRYDSRRGWDDYDERFIA